MSVKKGGESGAHENNRIAMSDDSDTVTTKGADCKVIRCTSSNTSSQYAP